VPAVGEQPAPTAGEGRSAPGEHGGGEEAPEAPVGATNMAVGGGAVDVAAVDSYVGVPEAPSTDWLAPSAGEVLLDDIMAQQEGTVCIT
jgi:hypothetical protein